MPDKDIELTEMEWEWGSRQDLLAFAETLGADELLQVDYAPPAMFTGGAINSSDDLCRFRREPRAGGGAMPYPRRWVTQMYRTFRDTADDIDKLPGTES
jgi:hypothetical protein